jgi:hypothetical protein
MPRIRFAIPLMTSFLLGGCGTYVPSIQEFPGNAATGQDFVRAIVLNVSCELQNAVNEVIRSDIDNVRSGLFKQRRTAWLDTWGVQMTLNLTVSERSTANPSVQWMRLNPADFTLAGGATLQAEATRINKLGSYYTLPDLVNRNFCDQASRPGGLFMMQSDLKLKEWLYDTVMLQGQKTVQFPDDKSGPFGQDVISHQVTFEVVSTGSITPAWKLKSVLIDPSGSLLEANRTRKHDLLLTFGPADKSLLVALPNGSRTRVVATRGPGRAAAESHLASEIGIAISSAIRSTPR